MTDFIEELISVVRTERKSLGAVARELSEMLQSSPRLQELLDDLASEIIRLTNGVHASDCAKHNGPALPAGSCSCGLHLLDRALQSVEYWKHAARERNDLYLGALEDLGKLVEDVAKMKEVGDD